MEKAIFLNKLNLSEFSLEKYQRIYFGSEFCERLIPVENELNRVISFCLENDKPLTLVTPFLTNKGLAKVKELLKIFYSKAQQAWEVVINDWGLLYYMKQEGYNNIVLGRLLTKQKRGPRISYLKDIFPDSALAHFKKFSVDKPEVVDFLYNMGVIRFELDNVLQGIESSSNMPKSVYYPYVYVSTTRYCLLSKVDKDKFKLRKIDSCNKECNKFMFVLNHKGMPRTLYLRGNTLFYKNDKLPDDLEKLDIDRVIFLTTYTNIKT